MFRILLILCLATLVSCASKNTDNKRLDNKINAESPKSLESIRTHFQTVLDAHPELNEEAKASIKAYLNETIIKQEALKEEESKVVQILLKKSLSATELSKMEMKDKNSLKHRLRKIYDAKADNIFSLVAHINEVSDPEVVNAAFENDMLNVMREFR